MHYLGAHASWTLLDDLLGQRYMRQHGGDQTVGWADEDGGTEASQAVYRALEQERAAVAALRRALEAMG